MLYLMLIFVMSGCVMIESYYRPFPGQGTPDHDFMTWNKPTDLSVDLSTFGQWLITQRLSGWENILHVHVSLYNASAESVLLTSDEVVIIANGKSYPFKLSEYKFARAPRILWASVFDVNFDKTIVREFTLILPPVIFDGQTVASNPVKFKREKGPIFYRILQ